MFALGPQNGRRVVRRRDPLYPLGAVRGIDPETGQYFDDTKRYLDALPLSEADRYKIFERQRPQGISAARQETGSEHLGGDTTTLWSDP